MSGPGEGVDEKPDSEKTAREIVKDAEKQGPLVSFPPLDKAAKCFYDTDRKEMWVGLPIGYVDPFFASVYLDASKLEFFKHSQREMPAMIESEKRKQSLLGKAREGVGAMMSRLGGLTGR